MKWGAIGLSVLLVIGGIYAKGMYDQKQDQREEDQQEYVDTTKRINNAPVSNTRDDALNRLRDMGDLR